MWYQCNTVVRISIHALLAESDYRLPGTTPWACYFYPRSPCGERRSRVPAFRYSSTFLSTLSLRRATIFTTRHPAIRVFLSTLSLRRATNIRITHNPGPGYFYPRSPCGERPHGAFGLQAHQGISIHALLAESDVRFPAPATMYSNFYPRSPCGERLKLLPKRFCNALISIHALLAESDSGHPDTRQRDAISIHALLAESDQFRIWRT